MGMIRAEKLVFEYDKRDEEGNVIGSHRAIDGVDIDVPQGSFVAILGHNGSGKSTLAKHMNAILVPTGGTMWVDGRDTKDPNELWNIRQSAGMVFQNPDNQIIGTVVEEEVGFGPENLGVPTDEIWKRVENSLRAVGMLERRKDSPNKLSGGQKQRVAIAIALACNPDLIIADEPTTALDVTVQRQILDLLKKIAEETHTAIVLVSHDLGVIASMCSRVLVMKEGRIVEEGSMEQIFYEPVHQVPEKKRTGEVILRTQGLGRSFVKNSLFGKSRSLEAVEPLSFEIHKGEIFGLVGESGSGKTTLARMLTGIIPPSCGSFSCEGKIQMIFQETSASFDPEFSLERILEEPLMVAGIGVAFAKEDDRGICEEMDRTLEEMRQDGTSLKIIGKYLDDPEKYLEVDDLGY